MPISVRCQVLGQEEPRSDGVSNSCPSPLEVQGESWWVTLPETNIAPENRPLEKEIPIGNHWAMLVLGRVMMFTGSTLLTVHRCI